MARPSYDVFRPRETGEEFEATHVQPIRESDELYRVLMAHRAPGPVERPYWTFKDAMRIIRDYAQPYPDAAAPTSPLGRAMLTELRDRLAPGDTRSVRFYTSAGKNSPLDVLHGVDAWLEADRPDNSWTDFVTFDLTLDPRKIESGYKADVIIGPLPDPDDHEGYEDAVIPYADRVVALLTEKRASHRGKRTHVWTNATRALGSQTIQSTGS